MTKQDIDGRVVLGIIIAIGAVIVFMREVVFPISLISTILIFIGLIIFLFLEKGDSFQEGSVTFYLGIAFLISLALLFISYTIGFGIGGTSFGQACTETYYTITGAEELMVETFDNATTQLISETCEVVDEQSCSILQSSAKAGKSIQELTEITNKFERIPA